MKNELNKINERIKELKSMLSYIDLLDSCPEGPEKNNMYASILPLKEELLELVIKRNKMLGH